jgi:hypothetical protein
MGWLEIIGYGLKLLFAFFNAADKYVAEKKKGDAAYVVTIADLEAVHESVVAAMRSKAIAEHAGAVAVEDQLEKDMRK